ncbi:unnamed protein product [Symbiodinium natans]|uniref:Uncharacterized protein n=1 Tax=Symbiodinium natans TaxID=878477 RepID=A0A812KRC0_9DINO|nr:unnamed protein product [Symbiodinium natans]
MTALHTVLVANCFVAAASYIHHYDRDGEGDPAAPIVVGIVFLMLCIGVCAKEAVLRAYSGESHHIYRVVPAIPMCCTGPYLQVPCADKSKSKRYYPGDVIAVLSNGRYLRATFVRVEEDFFPPKAEFQAIAGRHEPCPHEGHGTLPLLHERIGGEPERWLLSAAEMYDDCHCTVAPAEFIGFAPASWNDILQNLRTQVAAPLPALEPMQPAAGIAGGCIIA